MVGYLLSLALTATTAQPIEFAGSGGFKLQGEFAFPADPRPAAAVLLLPGSGPTDRNGNQPGFTINLLKDLSDELTAMGLVTFRFDKRAVNAPSYRAQWGSDPAKYPDLFSWKRFTDDVSAAYRTLRFHPRVRPNHVFILGHSEGGVFAIYKAAALRPRGLILLGTPGRDLGTVIIEQMDNSMDRQPVAPEVRTLVKAQNREVIASYRAGTPFTGELHPFLRPLYQPANAGYLLTALRYDPAPDLARFTGPVFIANGGKDIQVRAESDFKLLRAARPDAKATLVSGASHNFKAVGDPLRELGFAGPVLPELIRELRSWPPLRPN